MASDDMSEVPDNIENIIIAGMREQGLVDSSAGLPSFDVAAQAVRGSPKRRSITDKQAICIFQSKPAGNWE